MNIVECANCECLYDAELTACPSCDASEEPRMNDHADTLRKLKELGIEVMRCAGNNNANYHRQWAERIKEIHNSLAAIAALEAGRSGGSLADAANLYQQETGQELDPRAFCRAVELYAAAPQQPTGRSGGVLIPEAIGRLAQDEWMTWNPDYPAWGFLTDADRKAWGRVGVRIVAALSQQQPALVGVTDAMVEAATEAATEAVQQWLDWCDKHDESPEARSGARVALDAALSQQEAAPSVSEALISLRREAQASLDRVLAEQPNNTEGNNALRARINAIQDCIDLSLSHQQPAPVSEPAAHPDALPDGTFSKSTMKRHAALRGDAASREGLHAALCFLGELESVGNAKAGEIARGLRRLTTTGQGDELLASVRSLGERMAGQGDVERLVEAANGAECGCSLAERDSGHRLECWMPALREALAPFGQQQEGQG